MMIDGKESRLDGWRDGTPLEPAVTKTATQAYACTAGSGLAEKAKD